MSITRPRNKPQRDPALGSTTSAPATLGGKNRAKLDRAMSRLRAGSSLYELPSGQFKFGGNKFVPETVARQLVGHCYEPFANNRGWLVYVPAPLTETPT